ncbi:uncharacterized protein K452DRAFT_344021 [Aplosporella prunicola CBS 121167]|uniref:Uncharacterized protein n=1 Tax=Aplosporella prunicola CBS 121167 TaxID=1176127 RepID=A0A6A6AYK4_9PEZI|nr:uncharacterized protein K452DRAFT_344021 [Aplosporella prunicola CBS 121167]KAF2136338.1 hypothetical protein K452DRAFT_344021 [Aplosporella prunicola CBS 121167]
MYLSNFANLTKGKREHGIRALRNSVSDRINGFRVSHGPISSGIFPQDIREAREWEKMEQAANRGAKTAPDDQPDLIKEVREIMRKLKPNKVKLDAEELLLTIKDCTSLKVDFEYSASHKSLDAYKLSEKIWRRLKNARRLRDDFLEKLRCQVEKVQRRMKEDELIKQEHCDKLISLLRDVLIYESKVRELRVLKAFSRYRL